MRKVHHKGHEMDIEEFEKRQSPRAKRSRLEPFQAQIFELKAKGYANGQITEWLAANGLKISQEGLRKFIKSREGNPSPASAPSASTAPANAAQKDEETSHADDLTGLDKKQRREKIADQFIKSESTNPLLKRLKKE